jgi:penicillin-binding protein 1B
MSSARIARPRNDHARSSAQPREAGALRRFLTSPLLLAPLVVAGLIGTGVLVYFYQQFTEMIDAGLRGDIFVRSSGIYAAPPVLRPGLPMKAADLITHLKRTGYLEAGTTQNENRGQYAVRGNTVELKPSADAAIDGDYTFRPLRISFSGNGIQTVSDLSTREQLTQAPIEPEVLSSIIADGREKRRIIEYKDLPKTLVDAIVAVEDRQFFEHYGINWRGVLRAVLRNQQAGEIREGGSSISQQLVKEFWLVQDRIWSRKFKEAYMTVLLEQRLSKEQIMAMYCNQIYLGQRGSFSINGFGQAAKSYFDKDVSQLTLAESAMLAGIIRSPNRYSPYQHEERARDRRNKVLDLMVEAGKITRAQADKAKEQPLGLRGKGASAMDANDAPYFIDYLTKQLEANFDTREELKNMRIYSTLDVDLQRAAYQAVTKQMAALDKLFAKRKGGTAGLQTALIAMNPKTGEVLAMMGGRDYGQSQLNRVTEARRQPGSVFKPFVYAAALSEGADESGNAITPATMFLDAPREFSYGNNQLYKPGNYKDSYSNRKMTLRDALADSKNVITVELAQLVGFSTVSRLAERAGIPRVSTYPSMALGVAEATPLQVASSYTMFANQGRRVMPIAYTRVTNGSGATLKTTRAETREILSPQVAYLMTSMMQDVLDHGTGSRVRAMGFKGTAAGKTGSSRDGWFAGYTPNLVCVVWVGFDDNSDLGLTGGATAAPIWADFMMKALQLRPDLGGEFEDPGDIVTVDIDPLTGMIAQADTPGVRHELFLRGTEPGPGTPTSLDRDAPEAAPTPRREDEPPSELKPPPLERAERTARASGELSNYSPPQISIEVCSITGLLPVRGVCTRTAWRKFAYGKEPTQECSEARHEKQRLIGQTEKHP